MKVVLTPHIHYEDQENFQVFTTVRNKIGENTTINIFDLSTACTSLNLESKIKLWKISWSITESQREASMAGKAGIRMVAQA